MKQLYDKTLKGGAKHAVEARKYDSNFKISSTRPREQNHGSLFHFWSVLRLFDCLSF